MMLYHVSFRHLYKEWYQNYETITSMVVPRSSRMLAEDDDYGLFVVTVFRKVAGDFKHLAKEYRFMVRDFEFDESELEVTQKERQQAESEVNKQWAILIRWCRTYFSELFVGWMHVKVMRLFVESILRYGLPPIFQAVIMEPHKKTEKRLRELLKQLYTSSHRSAIDVARDAEDISETYPFVLLLIDWTIETTS
jgi:V-type H+-transporting ATPase subunit C